MLNFSKQLYENTENNINDNNNKPEIKSSSIESNHFIFDIVFNFDNEATLLKR
jgi:hypothetical protein